MKTLRYIIIATIFFAISGILQAQENGASVNKPSGYRCFIQHEINYRMLEDENVSGGAISNTHGFYFNENCYVGLGFGFVYGKHTFCMPIYTTLSWNISYSSNVSPLVQVRVGSYISSDPGTYADLGFGVRFASKKRFAVTVMATGCFYDKLTASYYDTALKADVEKKYKPLSAGIRIGVEL